MAFDKKKLYALLLNCFTTVCGIDAAKKFDTRLRFKRKLNLKHPQTLSDKVTWLQLHDLPDLAVKCTDKYDVRKYIREKGLEDILVPLVAGPFTDQNQIKIDDYPQKFVVKGTHGCKMNLIVNDKSILDMEACKRTFQSWLNTTYGTYSVEPHYTKVPHRLIVEDYLESKDGLIDYKFHCLNGKPEFVLVVKDRVSVDKRNMICKLGLYDMEWKKMDGLVPFKDEVPFDENIDKPKSFNKMVKIAKLLSSDFKFVRVDLYDIDGDVRFGELTFSPACGVFPYFSEDFNMKMGKRLNV